MVDRKRKRTTYLLIRDNQRQKRHSLASPRRHFEHTVALGKHFLYAYRYINEYSYGCIKRALEIAHIGILFWRMVKGLDIAKIRLLTRIDSIIRKDYLISKLQLLQQDEQSDHNAYREIINKEFHVGGRKQDSARSRGFHKTVREQ